MLNSKDLKHIASNICIIVNQKYSSSKKKDGSWVTDIDHALDKFLKDYLQSRFDVKIYSEEIAFNEMNYPCFIIDPLDGTIDFMKGSSEYSVSIAFAHSAEINDPLSRGWIYHPKDETFYSDDNASNVIKNDQSILVSRSEFEKNMYAIWQQKLCITAMGSICLKLAYLSQAKAQGVITLRPKSVWDIAAGSIILSKLGYSFFENGSEINKLENRRYGPRMFWAHNKDLKFFELMMKIGK